MKLKNNYIYENFKYYTETQSFLFIFILSIIFAAYGSAECINYSYLSSFILAYNNPFYLTGMLMLIFANTKNTYDLLKTNYEYIIRCNSKEKYFKKLIINVQFNNFILLIINIILIMIFLNLFCSNNELIQIKNYNIPHIVYLIFCIIKFLCLSTIVSTINICLLEKIDYKIVGSANILFIAIMNLMPINLYNISSIVDIPWSISAYLLSFNLTYSSFNFEILCFILYFIILYVITFALYKIVLKWKRDI